MPLLIQNLMDSPTFKNVVLIKSIKYVSFPGKSGNKQPSLFLKVFSLEESSSLLYLLIHLTNTYWNPTTCQTLDQQIQGWAREPSFLTHPELPVSQFSNGQVQSKVLDAWPSTSLFPNTIKCWYTESQRSRKRARMNCGSL